MAGGMASGTPSSALPYIESMVERDGLAGRLRGAAAVLVAVRRYQYAQRRALAAS